MDFIIFVSFIWLGCWAVYALLSLSSGKRDSIMFVILIHSFFYGIPFVLNLFLGIPSYNSFRGLNQVIFDVPTKYIYYFYMSICPIIWWWTGRTRTGAISHEVSFTPASSGLFIKLLLYIGLASPLILLVFAPNPSAYLKYGDVALSRDLGSSSIRDFNSTLFVATRISIIAAGALLFINRNKLSKKLIFLIPWLFLSTWLSGKRAVVFTIGFLLFYVFWLKGYLKGIKFYLVLFVLVFFTFLFSFIYQKYFNRMEIVGLSQNMQLDYTRDNTIKMQFIPRYIQIDYEF